MSHPIESYILTFPPAQQALLRAVRTLILETMPGVHEYVYHGALGYGVTLSPLERHCYLAPQAKGYVNLGFFFGAQLADPAQLLAGSGARLRHVKIWSTDAVTQPALRDLLETAWADAPRSIAALQARRRHASGPRTEQRALTHTASDGTTVKRTPVNTADRPGVSIFDAAGGREAFLRLADAHHKRCLADPVLNHPFSHPGHPQHVARLAAYWAEVFGGPPTYTQPAGGHSAMLELHARTGADAEFGPRFVHCFVAAFDDAGLPPDPALRAALRAYIEWAVGEVLSYAPAEAVVPAGRPVPRWTWDGLGADQAHGDAR